MPIHFDVDRERGYFLSTWQGDIADEMILDSYYCLYEGQEWLPTLNELADLSQANMARVSPDCLRTLADNVAAKFKELGIPSSKTAVYAPNDLPFGLARLYEAHTNQSPEILKIFRDFNEA